MRYKIRAYTCRTDAEAGATPLETVSTGNPAYAEKWAREYAEDYGCAVIADDVTGDRTWFHENS